MILLWAFFFVFLTAFCIGFTQTEKKYVKLTGDNIYNRIIVEFKANKEIIIEQEL